MFLYNFFLKKFTKMSDYFINNLLDKIISYFINNKLLIILINTLLNDFNNVYNYIISFFLFKKGVNISLWKILKFFIFIFFFFGGFMFILFIFYFFKYFFKYFFLICDYFLVNKIKSNNLLIKFYLGLRFLLINFFIFIPQLILYLTNSFIYFVKFKWMKRFIAKYILKPLDNFLCKVLEKIEYFIHNDDEPYDYLQINFKFKYIYLPKIKKVLRLFLLYPKIFLFKFKINFNRFYFFIKFILRKWFWLYLEIYLNLVFHSLIVSIKYCFYYFINYYKFIYIYFTFFFFYLKTFIINKYFFLYSNIYFYYYKFFIYLNYFMLLLYYIILFLFSFIIKIIYYISNLFWNYIFFYLFDIFFYKLIHFISLQRQVYVWLYIQSIYFYFVKHSYEYKNNLIIKLFLIYILANKKAYLLNKFILIINLSIFLIHLFF